MKFRGIVCKQCVIVEIKWVNGNLSVNHLVPWKKFINLAGGEWEDGKMGIWELGRWEKNYILLI